MHVTDHDKDGNDLVCAVCKRDIQRYEARKRYCDGFSVEYVHDGACEHAYVTTIIQQNSEVIAARSVC